MNSSATVQIKGLKLLVVIGTQAHERLTPQELAADISFEYDASKAAVTDELGDAVDYAAICARITAKAGATKFFLLERLGAFILAIIMEDTKIVSAKVSLEKAGAVPSARSVALVMSAQRTERTISTTRCY